MMEFVGGQQEHQSLPLPKDALTSIANVSDAILRAELSRRLQARGDDNNDKSACGPRERGAYNTSIHVMALFLILVLSTSACSFPIVARRFPRLPIPRRFLFLSRHFGTGVLIATAFVHLLPTAFLSLTDPCLPRFWSETYRAMAGFVAMISVFLVVLVEMFFAMKGAGHVHGSEYDKLLADADGATPRYYRDEEADQLSPDGQESENIRLEGLSETDSLTQNSASRLSGDGLIDTHPEVLSRKEVEDTNTEDSDSYGLPQTEGRRNSSLRSRDRQPRVSGSHQEPNPALSVQNPQRQLLQCLLLEAGILFHSIFIGMAVSVATGTSFVVLLVAISFHQTFEGFALGSRIASLIPDLFAPSSMKPWLMALAYGTTTPIGQALGLILHNLYDPGSTTGLLMVGITNAISSGLLLFAGLVELLAEDFLSQSSYTDLRGRRRVDACIAVFSGAVLMALVGAFA
ncbi:putative ZIP family zinc transporter [Aspergillus candidus]|uniref:Fe2+/Zn2+ regulated transporter n=1 Tax=Aspergillus candidus TaxID=41067 RepID=A0A2I2F054_ASPCN|nr:Fe2+/Zn2+ regulated transporter [Aspergillus candidus]PLB33982.1 Fe2+/Zn2+ regulated transporter [Aspergillus candidus]